LMTAGSTTFTFSMPGLVTKLRTAPLNDRRPLLPRP